MSDENLILPSKGSIVDRHQRGTKKFKKSVKVLNTIIISLYRINFLPLFGIGKSISILTTIGRKTGKKRRRPILCRPFHTGILTLYSARGKEADWLKNIFANENCTAKIQKGFKKLEVKATLIEDFEDKLEHLKYFCENFSDAKTIFGYDKKKHGDIFDTKEFKNLAQIIDFVQLIPV